MVRRRKATTIFIALTIVGLMGGHPPTAHEQLDDRQIRDLGEAYDGYLKRSRAMELDRFQPGLRDQAVYRLRRYGLQAKGLRNFDILAELGANHPPQRFAELPSIGDIRTLTVLIDFAGSREADRDPMLGAEHFETNIYGAGTDTARRLKPWDSVAQYYRRASEGKFRLQGDVLGWYSLEGTRSDYTPKTEGKSEDEKLEIWNEAYFAIAEKVLDAYDGQVDYSRYSNDDDDDIDLLTILYAGEADATTFWWKYAWQFKNGKAEQKFFDGKRLKQFIVCPVTRRVSASDFNPRELIHEYGHALGLPDLYDRDRRVGPTGGVGGLDVMDQKRGNHNGFSRWVLGWIEPSPVGSGPPAERMLRASGAAEGAGEPAIAIFPGLPRPATPHREVFVVENRYRVGNDGGKPEMPGDGLLIWHVDATLDDDKRDFKFNNSDTNHKLVRLVRAGHAENFPHNALAQYSDYFAEGRQLTPTSQPTNSDGYAGYTGVVVSEIGPEDVAMKAKIGFADSPRPLAFQGHGDGGPLVDLDALDAFSQQLRFENPTQLAGRWQALSAQDLVLSRPEEWLRAQIVLIQWASKDGRAAVNALRAFPGSAFSREVFPKVMNAWAYDDPAGAWEWYLDRQRSKLRESKEWIAGETFARTLFTWAGRRDPQRARRSVQLLRHPGEIAGAWSGLGAEPPGPAVYLGARPLGSTLVPSSQTPLHQPDECARAAEACLTPEARDEMCERICRPPDD